MPPSGPALWSSNNSIQVNTTDNTASYEKQNSGESYTMNNGTNNHNDVIGSLGKVLSSVNLAGEVDRSRSGHSTPGGGGGGGQGQYNGAAVGSNPGSWNGISGQAAPAPSGLSYNFYGNNNGSTNQPQNAVKTTTANATNNSEHDSLQNILYDSGIYEKEEVAHRRASTGPGVTSAPPSTPLNGSDRERKPSIDMFLSQSPSKALGEDAFRVMHRTASNPSLVNINGQATHNGGADNGDVLKYSNGIKPLSSTAPSSRSESPQNLRVGTGSSPAYNNGSRQQMVYPSQFNANANNYSPANGVGNTQQGQLHAQLQQQPSMSSQFSGSSNNIPGLVTQQPQPQAQPQAQQQPQAQYMAMPVPTQQAQPQVFYMAMPGPDGKQVLQPVQMVQMPGGQAGTLMMPVQAAPAVQSGQPNPTPDAGAAGQMMLMQPVQAGNNMNMYGQDSQANNVGSNNQYSQQSYGGYNDRYQKNDNLGGGQYQPDQGGNNLDQVPNNGSLSMLYASPQRPPLRALLGNVRRLSRDQVGCRLLQQALDEDGPSAATAILNEGLTFWAEAMVDPFGNYLFQKILERITPEERVTLVSSVSTRLVNASLNLHGTRSVQKIVEVCAADEEEESDDESDDGKKKEGGEGTEENKKEDEDAAKKKKKKKKKDTAAKILTDALKPSAARLCIDSHGNHAIQRILLKLPYQYTQFIFDAVAASVEDVARHRHGCCVIQRCLDSRHSTARTHLVARIVEKSLELMQDAYGNYVVQYVLDVCGDDEVHAICESVIGKVCLLAIQKFSSNVMEKCLERCTDRVREEYLNELNDSDRIRELMMDPFGNYVVQRALSVSTHAQAIRLVETMKPHLSSQNGGGIRNTAGGRRILGKICRRFPNFVLEGETFEDYDLNQMLARGSPHHHGQGGGGGRGGRHQNQFGNYPPHHGGPSPRHGRHNNHHRGGRNHQHHNQYQQHTQQYVQQQPIGHQFVQQQDMNLMQAQPAYNQQAAGVNPYLFPHNM